MHIYEHTVNKTSFSYSLCFLKAEEKLFVYISGDLLSGGRGKRNHALW